MFFFFESIFRAEVTEKKDIDRQSASSPPRPKLRNNEEDAEEDAEDTDYNEEQSPMPMDSAQESKEDTKLLDTVLTPFTANPTKTSSIQDKVSIVFVSTDLTTTNHFYLAHGDTDRGRQSTQIQVLAMQQSVQIQASFERTRSNSQWRKTVSMSQLL